MRQIGTFIVILFIVISLGIVGLGYIQRNQPEPSATPLELTLTVNPLAHRWMSDMVNRFNASDARFINTYAVIITLSNAPIDDMDVWQKGMWNNQTPPNLWIPSSTLSTSSTVVNGRNLITITPSLAKTPLVFVASANVAQAITQNETITLDWGGIQSTSQAGTWANFGASNLTGNVTLAFPLANNTMEGLMVMYSANAYFDSTLSLTSSNITPFTAWFAPVVESVPNFNTIGADVATFMASRGASVNIGIMAESRLLNTLNAITNTRAVQIAYPEYPVVFDFPLIWLDETGQTADDRAIREQVAQQFGEWLAMPEQQASLTAYGLRPVESIPTSTDNLFRLGIESGVLYDAPISPALSEIANSRVRALLSWFESQR